MVNTAFSVVLKDDNDDTLVNCVFANMALVEKFIKKYIKTKWELSDEDATEEWEVLYHEGHNDNGDKLYIEQCFFVNNEEDSNNILDILVDNSGM